MSRKSLWGALAAAGIASLFAADAPKQFTPQQRRWWAIQKSAKSVDQVQASAGNLTRDALAKVNSKDTLPNIWRYCDPDEPIARSLGARGCKFDHTPRHARPDGRAERPTEVYGSVIQELFS